MHSRSAYVSFILASFNAGAALAGTPNYQDNNYQPGPEVTSDAAGTPTTVPSVPLGTGDDNLPSFALPTTLSEVAVPDYTGLTDAVITPTALPPVGTGGVSGPVTTDNCGWLSAAGYTITCAGSPAGPTGEAGPTAGGYSPSRPHGYGGYGPKYDSRKRKRNSYGNEPEAIVPSPVPSGGSGGSGRAMCYQFVLGSVDEAGSHGPQQIPCYIVGGMPQPTWHHSGDWGQPSAIPEPSGSDYAIPTGVDTAIPTGYDTTIPTGTGAVSPPPEPSDAEMSAVGGNYVQSSASQAATPPANTPNY